MDQLSIIISTFTDTDYNNIYVTEKILSSTINGIETKVIHSESDTISDLEAKTNYKNKLIALGYSWDSEI